MTLRRFKVVLRRLPFPQTTTQGDPGRTWAWGRPHASARSVAALWPGVASPIGLGRHGKGTGCKSRVARGGAGTDLPGGTARASWGQAASWRWQVTWGPGQWSLSIVRERWKTVQRCGPTVQTRLTLAVGKVRQHQVTTRADKKSSLREPVQGEKQYL